MEYGVIHPAIVYGDIKSKRIPGRSLGLNILPKEYKICSYNCVYCERGLTNVYTTSAANRNDELPSPEDFERALESALRQSQQVDALTFSGNGEPTLHPQFEELVDVAMYLRDRYFPKAMVGILSNSSSIGIDKVTRGLVKLDYRMMKLDAGDTETFRIINRPSPGIEFQSLLDGLKTFENITIQTMFIDGDTQNIGDQEITAWTKCVGQILPDNVQIYSIHRPPAEPFVKEVSGDKLKQIASSATINTGVSVEVIVRDSPYRKRKRRYWK
jgi:wyosine [tRNA(Phe)-imidazoG37] synthetase (radical SAM superfamily)